jgi:hypothetical protein
MRSANRVAIGMGTPVSRRGLRRGVAGFLRVPRTRGRLTRRARRRGYRRWLLGLPGRGLRLAWIHGAWRLWGFLAGPHGPPRMSRGWRRPGRARNRASRRKMLMNGLGIRGRAGPTVGVPRAPVRSTGRRSSGRRSTADCHGGGRASRCDDTTTGHSGLDACGKRRRRGTTYPRVQDSQVTERLDPKPRESQHPEPNQEQHADRTAHKPQNPPPAARLVDQDVRRKIAHASPNPVTVGSTRSRQGGILASALASRGFVDPGGAGLAEPISPRSAARLRHGWAPTQGPAREAQSARSSRAGPHRLGTPPPAGKPAAPAPRSRRGKRRDTSDRRACAGSDALACAVRVCGRGSGPRQNRGSSRNRDDSMRSARRAPASSQSCPSW